MNKLNRSLQSIQNLRAQTQKLLDDEPDRDNRVKLTRRIARYNTQERLILKELNK